jgi:hypothetical protein
MNTMLPSAPKSFGRLTDVLASAYASLGGAKPNLLALKKAQKAVVILVDGLGVSNIRFQPGHAPFLNSQLNKSSIIECAFPSTTATSLTSFATGARAGKHPIIGYQVFDRGLNEPVNLLTGWSSKFNPERQVVPTISQLAASEGVDFIFCGPSDYENSGFTQATMPGAKYEAAKTIHDRFDRVQELLRRPGRQLIYLYVPELDQLAHANGAQSDRWINKLEELDGLVKRFSSSLKPQVGCLLTADHGIIDIESEAHRFLDELELPGLLFVGGDPRVSFLYFESSLADSEINLNKNRLSDALSDCAYVAGRDEVIAAGWYGGDVADAAKDLMPEIFVISKTRVALYHRRFAKPKSMQMVGQHGSITSEETKIPLLRFGAFAQ